MQLYIRLNYRAEQLSSCVRLFSAVVAPRCASQFKRHRNTRINRIHNIEAKINYAYYVIGKCKLLNSLRALSVEKLKVLYTKVKVWCKIADKTMVNIRNNILTCIFILHRAIPYENDPNSTFFVRPLKSLKI